MKSTTNKGELSQVTGKKRKHREESIEGDSHVQSPPRAKSNSQKAVLSSEKKQKKRKTSDASGAHEQGKGDVSMEEPDLGLDSADDDDDDDDDSYDDEEDESIKDFIVDDAMGEDEEEVEEGQEEQKEVEKNRRRRRKKKIRELDEDDIELIQDNIGLKINKFKRLKKHSERDQAADELEKNEGDLLMKADDEESEQREQIDTSTRRKTFLPSKAIVTKAKEIFDQPSNLDNRISEALRKSKQGGIEELFDGCEIDDQLATKQDKAIAEKDIPERLQLKIGERLKDYFQDEINQDILQESEYIFNRLLDFQSHEKRDDLLRQDDQTRRKIQRILSCLRKEYLDVPMIAKYRQYEYKKELEELDIWHIFNLDIEYGKFQTQKKQTIQFLQKLLDLDPSIDIFISDIEKVSSLQQLQNFQPLISYFKQYYFFEIQAMPEEQKKKLPLKMDVIAQLKKQGYDKYVNEIFLDPKLFVENILNNELINKPPREQQIILQIVENQANGASILNSVMQLAALQLAYQPQIRTNLKQHFYNRGILTTEPTAEGHKVLDVFHPSYRVKRLKHVPVSEFTKPDHDDLFLDIIQNEKRQLITLKFDLPDDAQTDFIRNLQDKYYSNEDPSIQRNLFSQMLVNLFHEHLMPQIAKEIKEELAELAENYVINQCRESYRRLLMTGPFSCEDIQTRRPRSIEDGHLPDRPRCTVMSVILQQVDQNTSFVIVAVVDKYGELLNHIELKHLLPPRKFNAREGQDMTEEEQQRVKKAQQSHKEEEKEHEVDRKKVQDLIVDHSVDLIVVGANKLEARAIKQVLGDIASKIKTFGSDEIHKSKGRKNDGQDYNKEAFVLWGSLEVPKLFANCYRSQKLLKNTHPMLKQAISLARFEQDPMCEILNLWSFSPSENQALQLNLHPFQKLINQAKLSDSLEEINVQCVNHVGVDLNLVIDHDHMHVLLSFVSGIGPRKARRLIQSLKQQGVKIMTRGDIFKNQFLDKLCHTSAIGFLKLRTNPKEGDKKQIVDILDMTRIHPESYVIAHKVARDIIHEGREVDQYQSYQAVKEVIMHPQKLKVLDIELYKQELEKSDQTNMIILLDYILQELSDPFKEPRQYRTSAQGLITPQQLFYMLIDETDRTFKRGIIVTATVTRVQESVAFCKLDNGLDASINKQDLDRTSQSLTDIIHPGDVTTGRIHEILDKEEAKFKVILNCKKRDLETHKNYVNLEQINAPEEDLKNSAFQVERSQAQLGRIVNRRINHPKFKNVNSVRAIQELQSQEVGDYIFRPSSKGSDHLTLTWKFFHNNIVHIDITEHDKAVGATIGSKLVIGTDEVFDNLQEIVERYIIPCNRHVREATGHIKFRQCETQEDLEKVLLEEKGNEANKIPYKMTILPQYPQNIVLGYIPKQALVKEYIRVKPRGFLFHDKCHNPIQNLINWFKENYRTRDYQKFQKRQKSPRAKAASDLPNQRPADRTSASGGNANEWAGVSNDWGQAAAASVHSANDDNNNQGTFINSDRGGRGRGFGGGGDSGRGRGCFNCGETGHISRDCPNKDPNSRPQRGRGRGRGDRDDGGRNSRGKFGGDEDQQMRWAPAEQEATANNWGIKASNSPAYQPPAWGNDNAPSNSPGYQSSQPAWGNTTENAPKSPKPNWGNDPQPTASEFTGWGSKTPQKMEVPNSGWGDNGNNTNTNNTGGGWGLDNNAPSNSNWGNNDNQGFGGNSPARSQMSQDDRGGRGRGRGRGRGENRGGGGAGGGGRGCFRCGEEGHMARECPNPDTRNNDNQGRGRGGGGGSRACFKCNQEGHMARECPNPDTRNNDSQGRGRGRGRGGGNGGACHKCHKEGHFARECPNADEGGDGGRPYKRQRRDDGGSVRRDDDNNNNQNWNSGGGDQWGANDGANQSNGGGWGAQESGNAWGNSNSNWGEKKQEESKWGE